MLTRYEAMEVALSKPPSSLSSPRQAARGRTPPTQANFHNRQPLQRPERRERRPQSRKDPPRPRPSCRNPRPRKSQAHAKAKPTTNTTPADDECPVEPQPVIVPVETTPKSKIPPIILRDG
ncbi:hypothetical protein Zmor_024124 [Zophobas morio]|uniref:Uncharacterized protein n=1 Tax=Zophobas morio TaxID=2755281 RepID=A0AA38HYB5_9CUCU|nr:hypothetical protein Zmor_024124 [Zophobas morio]